MPRTATAFCTNVGAAFVLLKRARDVFWILVGLALLGLSERAPHAPSAASGAALADWDLSLTVDGVSAHLLE